MRTSHSGRVCLAALALAGAFAKPAPAVDAREMRRALIRLMTPATQPATTQPATQTFEATDQPLKLNGATGQAADWLKTFDVPPQRFAYTLQFLTEDDGLRIYRLTYPSPYQSPWPQNNTVPAELYLPKRVNDPSGKLHAAIVLDILDGSAVIPRGLCRGLAEQGVAALYVPQACYGPRRPPDNAHYQLFMKDPSKAIDNTRQTVMDVRRAKAILAARSEIDPQRISITGVSLGGIMTALAAGVDGEFYRVVPILAGGDLAAITFHARETRLIRTAIESKGMTLADAEKLMAPIDPLNFASRIDPRSCLMINAARDEVIPKETTEALNKAIGSPQILWTPLGHYSSALFLPNLRQRTIEFSQGKKVEGLDL